MTILVMFSFVIAGAFGYKQLPVAAVPRVEFPTIQVTAQLPGASPETMAASVASILERQFSTIAGVTTMTSTSSLGNTSIVLQFDLNRSIDGAALDVQSAISSAMRRLPAELTTPPSFRKINPADFAVMFLALKSSQVRLSDIDAFANRAILPRISTLPGVAQVLIFGTQKYAVRVRANLDQLAVRGLTLQELQNAIVNANSSKPVGAISDNRQSSILDATGPINKAADYMPVIVTWQNGAPVRVSDVATAIDSVENDKVASWLNGTRAIVLGVYRQPDANTVEVVDRVKAMLPAIQAELPTRSRDRHPGRSRRADPPCHRRRRVHPGARGPAGDRRDLLLPAQFPGDADPGHRPADLGDRHLRRHVSVRPFARQHLAAGADAWPWASWSTTPSSCWRTSSATSRRARSRWKPPSRAPRRSASPSSR